MKPIKFILNLLLPAMSLLSLTLVLRQPHQEAFGAKDAFIYSKGNAPDEVRTEIIQQLRVFQNGYTNRDTAQVDLFTQALFSQENLTVLGTMPNEIFIGQRKVSKLIFSDWNAWGDCTFLIDNAHISSYQDVAWVSTIGFVKFDVPRFLIMPLRLMAVMVREDSDWKFQFLQFQFDLNLFFLFITIALISIWFTVNLGTFLIMLGKRIMQPHTPISAY